MGTWHFLDATNASSPLFVSDGLASAPPTYTRAETTTLEFTFPSEADLQTARNHLEYAGAAQYGGTVRGRPWFMERLPSGTPVASNVIAIEPQFSNVPLKGLWGLIVGGQETTPPPTVDYSASFEVFVLADLADYTTRADVVNALGYSVV